jgi:hypothetical protein
VRLVGGLLGVVFGFFIVDASIFVAILLHVCVAFFVAMLLLVGLCPLIGGGDFVLCVSQLLWMCPRSAVLLGDGGFWGVFVVFGKL